MCRGTRLGHGLEEAVQIVEADAGPEAGAPEAATPDAGAPGPVVGASRWQCPTCGRRFTRRDQQHSCRSVPLERHLPEGSDVRVLFGELVAAIEARIGPCRSISLPCCIHLAAAQDFLAVLPRRDRLEVRFTVPRRIDDLRIVSASPTSGCAYQHRVLLEAAEDIDPGLLGWIAEAYEPVAPHPRSGAP